MSEWKLALKSSFGTRRFFWFLVLLGVLTLVTLACDPMWAGRRRILLLGVAVLGTSYFSVRRERSRREAQYP